MQGKRMPAMPRKARKPVSPVQEERGKCAFPIVAMGASAGGLNALETFFNNMQDDSGMAFIVIQHIASGGKSLMAEILQKHTQMKVQEVADGMRVEQNCVYLNPPDKEVAIIEGILQLMEPPAKGGIRLPIDYFFRSLAADCREKAICVILSGTGTDGTLGLKAIKEVGGLALVQDPEQAQYDGMPRSAMASGLVDYVLPVESMPSKLIDYIKHPYLKKSQERWMEKQFVDHYRKILLLVRSSVGHDFTQYKQKTIQRRIERRMALHKIEAIEDYLRYLQEEPSEIHLLFRELLIGVTNFFRDPDAFDSLQTNAIPEILHGKGPGEAVRIWVPACSTGEEAVSLAILFTEAIERSGNHVEMQIFATDIDPEAIERARKAEYPDVIAADVSRQRLARFFIKKDGIYRVRKEIRERIVYAVQDIAGDPPFSRLDLLSCRNLLIYMDVALQKKIIPLFHFILNPGGYLFLGSSESIGEFSSLFAPVDMKWKIFRCKKSRGELPVASPLVAGDATSSGLRAEVKAQVGTMNAQHLLDQLIIEEYAPAAVLINDKYEALYFRGPVDRFFKITPGEASLNVLKIARSALSQKLPAALYKAHKDKAAVELQRIQIKQNGEIRIADAVVRPIVEPGNNRTFFVIVLQEKANLEATPVKRRKASASEETNPRILELEQELQATRESLQATVEEFEAANEELKSANEELQATNEEAQSTNEELVTAKEELQSTNEELITLNSELQAKVEELNQVSNDVKNLIVSTEIGTIFLDTNLGIKYFTPSMTEFFNLIPSDVGRPIGDITSKISGHNLREDAESVLRNLQAKESEVQAGNGKWFSMRILPYRTKDNLIDGVVVTFTDITRLKLFEVEGREARELAENILGIVREPILTLDFNFRVIAANLAFYRSFKTSPEETQGNSIYALENGQWDVPELHRLLEQLLPEREAVDDFPIEYELPSKGLRKMVLNTRRISRQNGNRSLILLAVVDISEGEGRC